MTSARKHWATFTKDYSDNELLARWHRADGLGWRNARLSYERLLRKRGIAVPLPELGQPSGTISERSGLRKPLEMSTHAIKTELHALLIDLRPDQKWHNRTRALDLVEFALDNLPVESEDARVQRARELARRVMPRLGRT